MPDVGRLLSQTRITLVDGEACIIEPKIPYDVDFDDIVYLTIAPVRELDAQHVGFETCAPGMEHFWSIIAHRLTGEHVVIADACSEECARIVMSKLFWTNVAVQP